MAKARSQFVCQQCGVSFSKWAGRCENCGEWNSLVEQVVLLVAHLLSINLPGAAKP